MPEPGPTAIRAGATALPVKGVAAVVIGNWLEFYDFIVFTFFAVMIGDAFFPAQSSIGRLLGALATFGVGFVTRPLGARSHAERNVEPQRTQRAQSGESKECRPERRANRSLICPRCTL